MLNCYFWIMRYRTSILCAQRASQTLVSGALKSHTEVERLLPLFWMLAYLGEISLFWASTVLNYILYAFYWCRRLLSPKEVNEKCLFKPKLYCFLSQISSFSSFSSNSSDGTHTRSDYPRVVYVPQPEEWQAEDTEKWDVTGLTPSVHTPESNTAAVTQNWMKRDAAVACLTWPVILKMWPEQPGVLRQTSFWPSIPAGRKQGCPMATRIEITERTKRVLRQLRNTSQKGHIGRSASRTPEWAKKLSWKSHLPLLNEKTSPSNLSVWFEQ